MIHDVLRFSWTRLAAAARGLALALGDLGIAPSALSPLDRHLGEDRGVWGAPETGRHASTARPK